MRIYDKRKQWGARTYNGLGSKFPLGYWKQGEVRSYASRRPTSIEIIELDGPNHCLIFRWIIGLGKGRNQDNNYTFCPDRGFTNIRHNNTFEQVGPKLPAKVVSLDHLQATVNNGVIKGIIPILDPQFGNVWTNIHQDSLKQAGIKLGDTLCVLKAILLNSILNCLTSNHLVKLLLVSLWFMLIACQIYRSPLIKLTFQRNIILPLVPN